MTCRLRLLLLASLLSTSATLAQNAWVNRNASPSGQCGGRLVYDAARQQSLLIGAIGCNQLNSWDGTAWTALSPPTMLPTDDFVATYDAGRDVIVAVTTDGSGQGTYEWDGTTWTQRDLFGVPPRYGCSLAYDAARGEVLLFGGQVQSNYFADLWAWDGVQWTLRSFGGPMPRYGAAFFFDEVNQTMLLFGGKGVGLGPDDQNFDDTWAWDGSQWHLHFGLPGPSPRNRPAVAYDSTRQRAVLYGGLTDTGHVFDTWEWDGAAWQQITVPGMGIGATIAYDEQRDVVVAWTFGEETWEYVPGVVSTYTPYGAGCAGPNGTPDLAAVGGSTPKIGTTLSLELSNLPPSPFNIPLGFVGFENTQWGGVPLPAPLDAFGFTGCQAWLAPVDSATLVNSLGTASWDLAIPFLPSVVGADLFFQAAVLTVGWNPGGFVFSNAGHAIVGNY